MARARRPEPASTPPPEQPPQPGTSGASVSSVIDVAGSAASGVATPGSAVGVAGSVAAGLSASAVARAVGAIVAAFGVFQRKRASSIVPFLADTIQQEHPEITPERARVMASEEVKFEREFRRKQIERLKRDLPEALGQEDPAVRQEDVAKVLGREKRYQRQREDAMAERSVARAEQQTVKEMSPQGAFWRLSRTVAEHTPDCLALGEKFWPWEVLDIIHPPLHTGCPCRLYTLDEAVANDWMDADQVPDTQDAVRRAKRIMDEFKNLREVAGRDELEEAVDELLLEEVSIAARSNLRHHIDYNRKVLRYEKGTHEGGRFRRKDQVGTPVVRGTVRRALRSLIPHVGTPRDARRERRGRWVWLRGTRTFIPEHRHFARTIGGVHFTSPAQSTSVYRNGKVVAENHPDLQPGKTPEPYDLGMASEIAPNLLRVVPDHAEHERVARQIQKAKMAHSERIAPVKTGQEGATTHRELQDAGFVVADVQREPFVIYYRDSSSGAGSTGTSLLAVRYGPAGKVDRVQWKPSHGPAPIEPKEKLLDRPPHDWHEFLTNITSFVHLLAREYGHDPHLRTLASSALYEDHTGTHTWDGDVLVGSDVAKDIANMAEKRRKGEPLTDAEKHRVYKSYWVAVHEALHGAHFIGQADYVAPGGKPLEEALTEELAHHYTVEMLRREGQTDVLEWARAHPDSMTVSGTYGRFRAALGQILDLAGVAPEERLDLLADLKMRAPQDERWDRLQQLVDAGTDATGSPSVNVRGALTSMQALPESVPLFVPVTVPDLADVPLSGDRNVWRGQPVYPGTQVKLVRPAKGALEGVGGTIVGFGDGFGPVPWVASVRLGDGSVKEAVTPGEITDLVDAPAALSLQFDDGSEIKAGDLIRYNGIIDGSLSEARVTRVVNDDPAAWWIEARTTSASKRPDTPVYLTQERVGSLIQRVPDRVEAEGVAVPSSDVAKPEAAVVASPQEPLSLGWDDPRMLDFVGGWQAMKSGGDESNPLKGEFDITLPSGETRHIVFRPPREGATYFTWEGERTASTGWANFGPPSVKVNYWDGRKLVGSMHLGMIGDFHPDDPRLISNGADPSKDASVDGPFFFASDGHGFGMAILWRESYVRPDYRGTGVFDGQLRTIAEMGVPVYAHFENDRLRQMVNREFAPITAEQFKARATRANESPEHYTMIDLWRDPSLRGSEGMGSGDHFDGHTFWHVTTAEVARRARDEGLRTRAELPGVEGTFNVGIDPNAVYLWPTRAKADEWLDYLHGRGIEGRTPVRVHGIEPSRLGPDHESFSELVLRPYLFRRSFGRDLSFSRLPSGEREEEYAALLDKVGTYEDAVGGPQFVSLREWLDRRPEMRYYNEREKGPGRFWYPESPGEQPPSWLDQRDPWKAAIGALAEMPTDMRWKLAFEFGERGRALQHYGPIPAHNVEPDFGEGMSSGEQQRIPDVKAGHVRLYVGTSNAGMEAARKAGAFERRDHHALANAIEREYGLPKDAIWNHPYFGYVRSARARDEHVYATGDINNAAYYAHALNESTVDALKTAHRILNDKLMNDVFYEQSKWKEHEQEFIDAWRGKHPELEPKIAVLDVPTDKFPVPGHVHEWREARGQEKLTPEDYYNLTTDHGAELVHEAPFPDRIPLAWAVGQIDDPAAPANTWVGEEIERHRSEQVEKARFRAFESPDGMSSGGQADEAVRNAGIAELHGLATTTRVFLASSGGLPLGVLTVDQDKGTVELAYVRDNYRRRGLATKLLNAARKATGLPLDKDTGERSPMGEQFAAAAGLRVELHPDEEPQPLTQREADAFGSRLMAAISMRQYDSADVVELPPPDSPEYEQWARHAPEGMGSGSEWLDLPPSPLAAHTSEVRIPWIYDTETKKLYLGMNSTDHGVLAAELERRGVPFEWWNKRFLSGGTVEGLGVEPYDDLPPDAEAALRREFPDLRLLPKFGGMGSGGLPKSEGHVAFVGRWEYLMHDGDLYRAPIESPIRADVPIRGGARFEARGHMAEQIVAQAREHFAGMGSGGEVPIEVRMWTGDSAEVSDPEAAVRAAIQMWHDNPTAPGVPSAHFYVNNEYVRTVRSLPDLERSLSAFRAALPENIDSREGIYAEVLPDGSQNELDSDRMGSATDTGMSSGATVEPVVEKLHERTTRTRTVAPVYLQAFTLRGEARRAQEAAQHRSFEVHDRGVDRVDDEEWRNLDAQAQAADLALAAAEHEAGGMVLRVPDGAMGDLRRQIDRLAKAASKVGVDPPTLTEVGDEWIERRESSAVPEGRGERRHYLFVQVHGDEPKIAGWSFLATLQRLDSGANVIRRVPGTDEGINLNTYRDGAKCDYCKTKRDRKNTYVLRKDEDGTMQQVGSNCIKDFLGHGDPAAIASYLENWIKIEQDFGDFEDDDGEGGGGRSKSYTPLATYLGHVATMMRTEGWIPRSQAYRGQATADAASENYYNWSRRRTDKGRPLWVEPTEEDFARGDAALEWLRTEVAAKENLSEFEHNMVALAKGDVVPDRGEGILAYAVVAHSKAIEREIERKRLAERGANSEWVGNVKDRVQLRLTVERVIERDTDYGVTFITKLSDADGNMFTWFASQQLEQGKTYDGKFTVKKHDEFQGEKQTVITRPSGLAEYDPNAPKPPEKPTKKGERVAVVHEGVAGAIEKAQRGFDVWYGEQTIAHGERTFDKAIAAFEEFARDEARHRASADYLHQGMPPGLTVKRGSYNPYTDHSQRGNLASRFVQAGEMVALRPKRDGDYSGTYPGEWVPARPPKDNGDDLTFVPAEVSDIDSGGTRARATGPDGVSVPLGEMEVIVKGERPVTGQRVEAPAPVPVGESEPPVSPVHVASPEEKRAIVMDAIVKANRTYITRDEEEQIRAGRLFVNAMVTRNGDVLWEPMVVLSDGSVASAIKPQKVRPVDAPDGLARQMAAARARAEELDVPFVPRSEGESIKDARPDLVPSAGMGSGGSAESAPLMTSWHLTDEAKFKLDPKRVGVVNSTIGGEMKEPGIFVTQNPEFWFNGHDYVRPFVAEIEHPADALGAGYYSTQDHYLPASAYPQSRVARVIPTDEYVREHFHDYGWIEDFMGEDAEGNRIEPHNMMTGRSGVIPDDYRYTGPDVREMTPGQVSRHKARVRQYIKSVRPHMLSDGMGSGGGGDRLREPDSAPRTWTLQDGREASLSADHTLTIGGHRVARYTSKDAAESAAAKYGVPKDSKFERDEFEPASTEVDQTMRQGTLAYLARLPSSEWGHYWRLYRTLFGPDASTSDWRKIRRLEDEIDRMKDEGIVTRSGHLGVRLTDKGGMGSGGEDYRGSHTAPSREPGMSLDDPTNAFGGDDIYGPNAIRYFGSGGPSPQQDAATQAWARRMRNADVEAVAVIQAARGKPDKTVTVYRAVPKDAPDVVAPGDWVTPSKTYAEIHGESNLESPEGGYDEPSDFKVVSAQVRAGDLFTHGDLWEWGWDPV